MANKDCSSCRYDGHVRAEPPCSLCEEGSLWERRSVPRREGPVPQADGDSGPDETIDSGSGFTHEIWYDSMAGKHFKA